MGSWDHKFDKQQTQECDFRCLSGESLKVQIIRALLSNQFVKLQLAYISPYCRFFPIPEVSGHCRHTKEVVYRNYFPDYKQPDSWQPQLEASSTLKTLTCISRNSSSWINSNRCGADFI
ncbi:hypothetical protein CSKR_108867 [Clonorchis sinensis]|uniref:Uncharacterized protein n=1 Tax=Clonorchis sinensis TaxID=79923 RepID=A0A419PP30_CLOSI|nr:hypothetical protein CSKR_108867 [Clonorchis sinensis]